MTILVVDPKLKPFEGNYYQLKDIEVTGVTESGRNTYITGTDNQVTISVTIDTNGERPSLPTTLVLPVIKIADGKVVDEVYWLTSYDQGVFTITGRLPSPGAWLLKKDRINQALDEINAGFRISVVDFTFRAVEGSL